MKVERWRQVDELLEAALERGASERSDFLKQACKGDEDLRREVESLLAAYLKAGSFIEASPTEDMTRLFDRDQPQSIVGKSLGRYKILALLGTGGMGQVYRARDTTLGREVAVKVLPAAFTQDAERVRRFEQEARAASSLNHPNIITIHEIGQASTADCGVRFIATEFVDGETLREQMAGSPMEPCRALDAVLQVASALSETHGAGIIHRDIKPENIMVRRDGLVKVLDFGLAKLSAHQPEMGGSDVSASFLSTAPGIVMGTVRYMSPEQARGLEVDPRTDIFSLGVMLYEMIAGRAPFVGATPGDVMAAILVKEPLPLSQYSAGVPAELQRIITKALRKDREERYQTIKDLLVDLKGLRQELEARAKEPAVTTPATAPGLRLDGWFSSRVMLAWAAVIVVVVAGLGSWLVWRSLPARSQPEIRSLAVLPLENLSGDPAQEYFADGMTEALIGNLAQIHALSRVISRTSVMRYKGSRSKSLPEIAKELNVDAVIEGTVQRAGGRVHVTARLIPAAADSPSWSRDYDRDETDVLKLESEVARAVADEIRVQVTAEERARLASAGPIDPAAHEAFLLGHYYAQKFNEEDFKRAIGYLERAIQLAPAYAAAYAELSEAWRARGVLGAKTFKEVEAPAREAVGRALELDPNLADAHAHLGNLKYIYDRDWPGAEEEMKRAVALDPNSLFPHLAYAYLLMALGRFPEALTHQQSAAQLDPTTSLIRSDVGRILYFAGKYDEAIENLNRALELDPRNNFAYSNLAGVYEQMGRYEEALAALDKAQSLRPNFWLYQAQRARVHARAGRRREALRMIEEFKATGGPGRFPEIGLAQVYPALGEKGEAFRLLLRVIEERDQFSSFIKIDPSFDSLHSDPRWKELLRRMNFPPVDSGK